MLSPEIGTIAIVVLTLGCGDSQPITPPDPQFGALRISNTTAGPVTPPGPPYFNIRVDSGNPLILHLDTLLTVDSVEAGTHTTSINLLRSYCTVPDTSIAASVVAAETTTVHFDVSCQVNWGFLAVALPTSGPNQPNLLLITFDGSAIGGASPNTVGLGFPFVLAGSHTIGLTGAGGNCSVAESNPQNVVIPLGDTLHVTFTLTCS
jgi:hypothetical protein